MKAEITAPNLSKLVQDFFCRNLINQRNLSGQTVASYRDTFRLLLKYDSERLKKVPASLCLEDIDRSLVLGFLGYLETQRKNCIRTRNLRLAAIRSFMNYVSYRETVSLPAIQSVLSIPMKRFERPLLGFLSLEEMQAILNAPDASAWSGRRDRVMFKVFHNTGARASEVIGMRIEDLQLERSASVIIRGKGRKMRLMPLWKTTAKMLRGWLKEIDTKPHAPVFPNRAGGPLSLSGVEYRLRVAVAQAVNVCPALKKRSISPHTLRHTTAMHFLQSGTDQEVIALWLGHESLETTHMYMEADLAMKEQALRKLPEIPNRYARFTAKDSLLAFLETL